MEEITLTAAQAAERALSIKLGFGLFIVIAICVTVWAVFTADRASKCSLARSEAIKLQVHDRNRKERQEWIDTNCELAAQVEQLKASVADLTCENDRNMDFLKAFNLSDIRLLRDNLDYVVKILNDIKAESKDIGGEK